MGLFPEIKIRDIVKEANELVSIFVCSVRTTKGVHLCNLTSDLAVSPDATCIDAHHRLPRLAVEGIAELGHV